MSALRSGCDVLVADDSGHAREILSALLRQFCPGIEIREVRDGAAVVEAWVQWEPRITFLDIDMPGQNGLEILQALRENSPQAFVAMVTGHSSIQNVQVALAGGANGFIVKPFKPQRIVDVLERYRQLSGHDLRHA